MEVFKSGNELISVGEESPTGFAGVLFVCYRGENPSVVKEGVIAANQLTGLPKVEPDSLSAAWREALRLPARITPVEPPIQVVDRQRRKVRQPNRSRPSSKKPIVVYLELTLGPDYGDRLSAYGTLAVISATILGATWVGKIIGWLAVYD